MRVFTAFPLRSAYILPLLGDRTFPSVIVEIIDPNFIGAYHLWELVHMCTIAARSVLHNAPSPATSCQNSMPDWECGLRTMEVNVIYVPNCRVKSRGLTGTMSPSAGPGHGTVTCRVPRRLKIITSSASLVSLPVVFTQPWPIPLELLFCRTMCSVGLLNSRSALSLGVGLKISL